MDKERAKGRKVEARVVQLEKDLSKMAKKKEVKLEELVGKLRSDGDGTCKKCATLLIVCGQYAEKLKKLK